MYELQFVLLHSSPIITSLIACWQSIAAAVQKFPNSVVNSFSNSPQTVDVSWETIILKLAVDLLHVMYIGYQQMLVFSFIFDLLWTGRCCTGRSAEFLWFRALKYIQQHGSMGPWATQSAPWLCHVIEMPGHVVLSTTGASGLYLAQPVQTGYRTLCWGPLTCLFIRYGVSFRSDKTAGAWTAPHIPIPPRISQ